MGAIITALIGGIGLSHLAPFMASFASQAAANKACEQTAKAIREMEKIREMRRKHD